jgi:hypothetical protein
LLFVLASRSGLAPKRSITVYAMADTRDRESFKPAVLANVDGTVELAYLIEDHGTGRILTVTEREGNWERRVLRSVGGAGLAIALLLITGQGALAQEAQTSEDIGRFRNGERCAS